MTMLIQNQKTPVKLLPSVMTGQHVFQCANLFCLHSVVLNRNVLEALGLKVLTRMYILCFQLT